MKTELLLLAGVGLLWCSRRQPATASPTRPAQGGWLEHAPVNPSDWYGDQWQRLSGGDIAGVNPAPGNKTVQDAPLGYYIDPTNLGGALLSANAPGPYQATVGKDPMLALFG